MAEEDVRRNTEGEDELLQDSIALAQRARQMLALSVRQLHRLGQDAAEIAAALSIDIDAARRILPA